MEKPIMKTDVPGIANCRWNHSSNVIELGLSGGLTAIVKFQTCITDGMRREVEISSDYPNVGTVNIDYGDSLAQFDSLVKRMRNVGFVIDGSDEDRLCNVLIKMGKNRKLDHYYHCTKGVVTIDGLDYIVGENIITETDAPFRGSKYTYIPDSKTLMSEPKMRIKGDEKSLKKGLSELVLGRAVALELVFIIGATGIVCKILKDYRVQNIILSIVGDACRGKNSILLLPAAMWTLTDDLTTEIATEAGLRRFISDGNTLPLVANDITVRRKELQETFSAFADGRGLLKYNGTAVRHYRPLLISSNPSVLDIVNYGTTTGSASRIFEIHNETYTDSAEHAEAISVWTGSCYGVAGEIFLKHLGSFNEVEPVISKMYETYLTEVRNKHSAVNGRQQQKIALVLTTGRLLGEALGVVFRLADIRQLLADCVAAGVTRCEQSVIDVMNEIKELATNSAGKLYIYQGTFDGYDPDVHAGIMYDDILYCKGKKISSCDFSGRSNEPVKRQLVDMGVLLTGERRGKASPRENSYTYRLNGINGTFYAFNLQMPDAS